MNSFITSDKEWRSLYSKNRYDIWFIVSLSNDETIYLRNYKEWLLLKNYCESNKYNIVCLKIRYKSHIVSIDTKNSNGVYLVKSILGSLNSKSIDTITSGILKNNIVRKTIWTTPELVEYLSEDDSVDNCFEKALIYNYGQE